MQNQITGTSVEDVTAGETESTEIVMTVKIKTMSKETVTCFVKLGVCYYMSSFMS